MKQSKKKKKKDGQRQPTVLQHRMTGEMRHLAENKCSISGWTGDARKNRRALDLAFVLCVSLCVEKFSTERES